MAHKDLENIVNAANHPKNIGLHNCQAQFHFTIANNYGIKSNLNSYVVINKSNV